MSTLPPKADIDRAHGEVRFVPKQTFAVSFDRLVSTGEECLGCGPPGALKKAMRAESALTLHAPEPVFGQAPKTNRVPV
jgi:hypothetical protein